jgi:transposase
MPHYSEMASKHSKTQILTPKPPRIPANRKLTKELVADKMAELSHLGLGITAKSLYDALGRKGSYATLTKWRREIETEDPGRYRNRELASSLKFIEGCDRTHLPAIEEALSRRRRIIQIYQSWLVLGIGKDEAKQQSMIAMLEQLDAHEREGYGVRLGLTVAPTTRNLETLLANGFVASNEQALRGEVRRLESMARK